MTEQAATLPTPASNPAATFLQRNMHLVDLFEKCALTIIFLFYLERVIRHYMATGAMFNLLFIVDQAVVLGFILFRRSAQQITTRGIDWLIGFAGTFLPLLVIPVSNANSPIGPIAASLIMLVGFIVHFSAKLSLRRSMGVVAANRGVRSGGAYRLVRHPMYAGYFITQTGLLLGGPILWNVAVIVLGWMFLLQRIEAEERVLAQDPAYRDFMQKVRWRLIPGVW